MRRSSHQYTLDADRRVGRSKVYWAHSAEPRWSHQVKRGTDSSSELFGSRPSLSAVSVSARFVCDALFDADSANVAGTASAADRGIQPSIDTGPRFALA